MEREYLSHLPILQPNLQVAVFHLLVCYQNIRIVCLGVGFHVADFVLG